MNWAAFLTYTLTTASTPGPNNILSMSSGSRQGFVKTLPFNLGIWLGFSLVSLMSAFFLNALARFLPVMKLPMLALGAAYMLYLARGALYPKPIADNQEHTGFLRGLFLQFINPKEYIYCMVSLEAYVLPHFQGQAAPLLGFALLLAFIGFAFTLLWSGFGAAFRKLFVSQARLVGVVMALLLIYCSLGLLLG